MKVIQNQTKQHLKLEKLIVSSYSHSCFEHVGNQVILSTVAKHQSKAHLFLPEQWCPVCCSVFHDSFSKHFYFKHIEKCIGKTDVTNIRDAKIAKILLLIILKTRLWKLLKYWHVLDRFVFKWNGILNTFHSTFYFLDNKNKSLDTIIHLCDLYQF